MKLKVLKAILSNSKSTSVKIFGAVSFMLSETHGCIEEVKKSKKSIILRTSFHSTPPKKLGLARKKLLTKLLEFKADNKDVFIEVLPSKTDFHPHFTSTTKQIKLNGFRETSRTISLLLPLNIPS